jgi:zinc transport system permease protein
VGLGYFLGVPPILCAGAFSLTAAVGIGLCQRRLKASADTAIGIIWAVGMALGVIFIHLHKGPTPDLMSYLFGNILTISNFDIILMAGLDAVIIALVLFLYKEFLAISFDEEYSEVAGLKVELLYIIMLALIALTVVVMIRVVGIILVIALLTIPAATARLLVTRLSAMIALSVAISGACSVAGVWLCYPLNLPAGPVIILISAVVYVLTALVKNSSGRAARGEIPHG